MANKTGQKLKLLYVMNILLNETDEEHPLNANDIIGRLQELGIEAERKSIYADISTLLEYGLDIEKSEDYKGGYYIADKSFELAELKMLVDAISSSRFISEKKAKSLVDRIAGLGNVYDAQELSRQVVVPNRNQGRGEKTFYAIDTIYRCIDENHKMSFKYFKWNAKKEKEYRYDGESIVVSPACLMWFDENYYLVAEETESREIRHFRLDRMKNIHCLEEKAEGNSALNINEYAAGHFNMMGGTACRIRLRVHNELTSVLLDKYGKDDIFPMPYGENQFECSVDAVVSEQFFGWLAGFGGKMQLVGPEELCREYHSYLAGMLERYEIEVMK